MNPIFQKRKWNFILNWFLFLLLLSSCRKAGNPFLFNHQTVFTGFPEKQGARYGTPALADFDNDGDLDFAMSEAGGIVYWFEFQGSGKWADHKLGDIPTRQLGGGAFDIDQDGFMDFISGGWWFRNTGNPIREEFRSIPYDTTIRWEIHDLVFSDIDGNGDKDLVVLGDTEGLFWYRIPSDPVTVTCWEKNSISADVLNEASDIHGGFFPNGIGDLDGDGDMDIVLPNRWYRNEDSGKKWSRQFLPYGSGGYWGLSARSWILDMDQDGDHDIVMVNCDQKDSRGAWLENDGHEVPSFIVHLLPLSAPGRRGSFHSLFVGDLDNDQDPDIFTMDQEDSWILPEGAPIRAYIWENVDGYGKLFIEHIILDKNMGGHDALFGDVDGDGDLDAYFKVWANLPSNSYQGQPHVDFLENLMIK